MLDQALVPYHLMTKSLCCTISMKHLKGRTQFLEFQIQFSLHLASGDDLRYIFLLIVSLAKVARGMRQKVDLITLPI